MNELSDAIVGSYDPALVFLSILIALLASYTALDVAGRVSEASGKAYAGWLLGGGLVLGAGIWSMHFVGMLALKLPVPASYDAALTIASLLIAIAAAGCALF